MVNTILHYDTANNVNTCSPHYSAPGQCQGYTTFHRMPPCCSVVFPRPTPHPVQWLCPGSMATILHYITL